MARVIASSWSLRQPVSGASNWRASAGAVLQATGTATPPAPKTYYFSAAGSDANDGLTTSTPKQTLAGFAAITWHDGDTALFRGGDTFTADAVNAIYTEQPNFTASSYGTGRATIATSVDISPLYSEQPGTTFSNLIVTGPGTGTSLNLGVGIYCQPGNTIVNAAITGCTVSGFKQGILIGGADANSVSGTVTISGNEVSACHDGIFLYGGNVNYGVIAGTISGNYCHDNLTNGLVVGYCKNVTISGNFLSTNGGNSAYQGPCGLLVYNCDSCTVTGNEAYNNLKSSTQDDGLGLDVETSTNIVVEKNYSHDNDAAGLQLYNYAGTSNAITFRYNISIDDGRAAAPQSAMAVGKDAAASASTNVRIYGNTVIQTNIGKYTFTCLTDTGATGFVSSNIFWTSANQKPASSSSLTINKNTTYGGTSFGTNAQTASPQFIATGTKPTMGWNAFDATALNNYRVTNSSPVLNAGEDISSVYGVSPGSSDFFGATLGTPPINQGAYDGAGLVTGPVNASAAQSLTMNSTAVATLLGQATATNSLSLGQTATVVVVPLAANATATQSLSLGQTATATGLIQGAATNSLSMGQTATAVLGVSVNAVAANSLALGQAATATVLDQAQATNTLSMGQAATATTLVQAVASQSLSMGSTATGTVIGAPINATASQSLSMGQSAIAATTLIGQATLYWDFSTGSYAGLPLTALSFTRSGKGWAQNSAGDLIEFADGVARITDLGLFVNEVRTNSVRNPIAAGGSAGVAPTNWYSAMSGGATGVNATWIGGGTEGNIEYFDVRLQGTPSTSANVVVGYETATQIVGATGQTWGHSAFLKIVGGSATNTSLWRLVINENTSTGVFVAQQLINITVPATSGALGLNRRLGMHTTAGGGTVARVQPYTMFAVTSGQAVDVTLRIGLPQLELASSAASFVTEPIKSDGTNAVTRNTDVPNITGTNFSSVFNQTQGSIYVEGTPQVGTASSRRFLDINNGSTAERYVIAQSSTANQGRFLVTDNSASQVDIFPATVTALANNRIATRYKQDDFAVCVNAGTVQLDTVGTVPTPTQLSIGIDHAGSAGSANGGPIKAIGLWSTPLSNANLQALTTSPSGSANATATNSLTMGQSAVASVTSPISATATNSLTMGQTATVTGLLQAQASNSLTMGQAATAQLGAAISAVAAQSIGMGQTATATVLGQASAAQSLSMGSAATSVVLVKAAAAQSLSMGQAATAQVMSAISATATQSLSMGQAATVVHGSVVSATATQSLSMGQAATVGVVAKLAATNSLTMGQVATVTHGITRTLTAVNSFRMDQDARIVKGSELGGPVLPPIYGSIDIDALTGSIVDDTLYGDLNDEELLGSV